MQDINKNLSDLNALIISKETQQNYLTSTNAHIKYLSEQLSKKMHLTIDIETMEYILPDAFEQFLIDLRDGKDFSEIKKNLNLEMKTYINEIRKKIMNVDIVHVQHAGAYFQGIIAKLFFEKKLIVTSHSLISRRVELKDSLGEKKYIQALDLESLIFKKADSIVVTYKSIREELLKLYPWVRPTKISVIYNGIDTNEFDFKMSLSVLHKYNIDPTVPYVILTGTIRSMGDVDYIKQFVDKLLPEYQIVFLMHGADNEKIQDVLSEIVETKSGVINVSPRIAKDDKIVLYSHASVACYSLIYEPSSFAILESLACGTPVVCAAIGCAKEIIKHGESGFLIEPGLSIIPPFEPSDKSGFINRIAEATNRALSNRGLNRRLSLRSRESIEKIFSWEIIAEKTAKLYMNLFSKTKKHQN